MIPCARDELVGESEPYLLPAIPLSVDVYEASLFKTRGPFRRASKVTGENLRKFTLVVALKPGT